MCSKDKKNKIYEAIEILFSTMGYTQENRFPHKSNLNYLKLNNKHF